MNMRVPKPWNTGGFADDSNETVTGSAPVLGMRRGEEEHDTE
jgi:hypothetical protein